MKAKIGGYQAASCKRMTSSASCAPKTDLKNPACATARSSCRAQNISCASYRPGRCAFTECGITTFSSVYTLTPEFDRMGCRLDGRFDEHAAATSFSDGIAFWRVCGATAGKPIIMLADRQTTGGYAKSPTSSPQDFRILRPAQGRRTKCASKAAPSPLHRRLPVAQRATLNCLRSHRPLNNFLFWTRRNDTWPLILHLISIRSRARRKLIREGVIDFPTAGMCRGYAQANPTILPPEYAGDFEEFARRNPSPAPFSRDRP